MNEQEERGLNVPRNLSMGDYLIQPITCGCGDIRYRGEFCHICGKCQMGCCMCAEELEMLRRRAGKDSHER